MFKILFVLAVALIILAFFLRIAPFITFGLRMYFLISDKLEKNKKKYVVGSLLLITVVLFIIIFFSGRNNTEVIEKNSNSQQSISDSIDVVDEYKVVDSFVEQYNYLAENKITNLQEINITDSTSEYYRTEFRLNPFNDSKAKRGYIGDNYIDIINFQQGKYFRIYVECHSVDEMITIIKIAAPIMDATVDDESIEDLNDKFNSDTPPSSFLLGDEISGSYSKINNYFMLETSRVSFLE